MNWIKYLLEANLYLVAFYALYYIIFRKETHYHLYRIYLLASSLVAFIIPLVQIGYLNPPGAQVYNVAITTVNFPVKEIPATIVGASTSWSSADYLLLVYGVVALIMLLNLIFKIYRLTRLAYVNKHESHQSFKLIELTDDNNAFSFFNYLFITPGLAHSSTIIQHELVHIRQKHSWDIIFMELLKVINWFNPVIYLMQHSIKEVHEFIADQQTVNNETDPALYTDFLVNSAYGINQNILTNTFFNKSLLKKRIMMLHQKRSGNAARLKYLLILPLLSGLLCASTLVFAKDYGIIDLAPRYSSSEKLSASLKDHKTYRLKFTSGKNSFITDKISYKANGKMKIYTANSLTAEDKAYLLKTQHVKLEVITVDNVPNKIKNEPTTIERFAQSSKPAPDTVRMRSKVTSVTSKGYKYNETAYLVNKKANFRVIITGKNGEQKSYYKNSATAAQLQTLKEKYGYTFPTMEIFSEMPPPPPVPPARPPGKVGPPSKIAPSPPIPPARPTVKVDTSPKPPPPPPAPPVKTDESKNGVKFPPPTVMDNGMTSLGDHLLKNIHYPTDAVTNGIIGNVIVQFTINNDHSITDIKIIDGIGHRCDEEVVRVLKSYKGTVDKEAGDYMIGISFNLINEGGKKPYVTKPVGPQFSGKPNFIADIQVYAYI